MIQRLTSKGKSAFLASCKFLREIAFPPFCVACKERCETKWFCPSCWELSFPLDSLERCPHCFVESEGLCRLCQKKPEVPFRRAYVFERDHRMSSFLQMDKKIVAAFMVRTWCSLNWEFPDLLFPTPGSEALARSFSELTQIPISSLSGIEENASLLLIDTESSIQELKEQITFVREICLKSGSILSLFPPV